MTILNNANHGDSQALFSLCRALAEFGPIDGTKGGEETGSEHLVRLCAPSTLDASTNKHVARGLTTWLNLGLFMRHDQAIDLAPFARERINKIGGISAELVADLAREILMRDENNPESDYWGTQGSCDLTRALSLFLAQKPFFAPVNDTEIQDEERLQLKDREREILAGNAGEEGTFNSSRWSGFQDWCTYLGFGWFAPRAKGKSMKLVMDPTVAIRRSLEEIFGQESELETKVFIERLARILPVLDYGRYRERILERLSDQYKRLSENELSITLSLALVTLDVLKVLKLDRRSDALAWRFNGKFHIPEVTHVLYVGRKK